MGHHSLSLLLAAAFLASSCADATHTVGYVADKPLAGFVPDPTRAGTSAPRPEAGPKDAGEPDAGALDAEERPCEWTAQVAQRRRLDLYVMVDANISVPLLEAWNGTVPGFTAFMRHPDSAGVGLGLRFFGAECQATVHAVPSIGVGLLPDHAQAVEEQLNRPLPLTPMSAMQPALEGAILFAERRLETQPQAAQAVVLMTDHLLNLACASTLEGVVAAARAGYQGSPSVRTYVIGLGAQGLLSPLEFFQAFQPLDQVALAGGATGVLRVSDADMMESAFHTIRSNAQPCDYRLPEAQTVDAAILGLQTETELELTRRVADEEACGTSEEAFFVESGAATCLRACPGTCARIRNGSVSSVALLSGCPAPGP